jgi:hypothetical protein
MHHSAHDRFPSSYCANADDENAKSVMAVPIKINFFMTRPYRNGRLPLRKKGT